MVTSVRTFKYTGYQKVVCIEGCTADRAASFYLSIDAKRAAFNVHKAVFAPGYGRVRIGFYQFALVQFHGTDRAGLGIAGGGLSSVYSLIP